VALSWHAVNGLFAARMGAFPATLDERQHLSFIRAMEAAPQLPPRYEVLRVLDPSGARFAASVNHLNHPSPYYLAMGPVDRLVGGSALGLRLATSAGRCSRPASECSGWPERAVFAAPLVLLTRRSALLPALGLALCGRSNHTVLMMVGFGALIAEVLRLRFRAPRPEHWASPWPHPQPGQPRRLRAPAAPYPGLLFAGLRLHLLPRHDRAVLGAGAEQLSAAGRLPRCRRSGRGRARRRPGQGRGGVGNSHESAV
jgi:hypothetical protein